MELTAIKPILKSHNLRSILSSRDLAHLGDFLANYIYSTVKIGIFGVHGSIHVWDNVLRDAIDEADMRKYFGKKIKPDKVADGAEAFIAFAYLNKIMNLDEMIEILASKLKKDDLHSLKSEKIACSHAFSTLLKKILTIGSEKNYFNMEN